MIQRARVIKLLQRLIRIDSQNPPGDEWEIGNAVKEYLKDLKIQTKIYVFKKRRLNVLGFIPGRSAQKSLLVTPHLDTVPAGTSWKVPPLKGVISGNRLYGLGATDCKVNLAVSLEVIRSLIEDKTTLAYSLVFAATADEESGSDLGLIPLLEKNIIHPNAALVLDADEFEIVVTQKGLMHCKVKIEGKRAHGAYPWQGVNAISIAMKILQELESRKSAYPHNRFLRPPTVNIGTIRGGDKVNVVADWCEFELDFRFLPGMSAKKLLTELKRTIRKFSKKFSIEIEGIQEPYYIPESHNLVTTLSRA
ncbi:MAG: M20/M25/M40 family metallo-hydrolase, partial [Candidatus Omnitrophica bacterium]|nr:M20/M25/M40 family metallo-hydrolase [Candidatus Omnitrophota bacterium]